MSERIRKEQDWADRRTEDSDPGYEKTYRDGSAVHECWNERKEEICSRKTKKLTKGLAISRDV